MNKMVRSLCRQKILKALSARKEVNIMKLVQIVNSTYNEVDRNLRILEDAGIITQQYFGRKRIARLNFENKKALFLLEVIRILEAPADHKNTVEIGLLRNSLKKMTTTYANNTQQRR
ncbi:helix-turn-helix domain-containing protein [Candidatus Bathyarchaeota archaeon]|nr:helix-turn-helix domain-containing protein [Candidatus Bathyarchaeota archaeon]